MDAANRKEERVNCKLSDYVHFNPTGIDRFTVCIAQSCTYKAVRSTTLKDISVASYWVLTNFRD